MAAHSSRHNPEYAMLVDEEGNALGTADNPIQTAGQPPAPGSITTEMLSDDAVTTPKIADGAVTDAKLATPKIDKPDPLIAKVVIGTTLSTNVLGMVAYDQSPTADALAMYQFGGQLAAADPQADGDAATKKYVDDAVTPKLTATQAAAQADSTATDVAGIVADHNALLAKLRAAGIIATEEV